MIKKIIFYLMLIFIVFIIYKISYNGKINYIALGDSLAEGINPYGEIGYGYTDYFSDYFRNSKKLRIYNNEFVNKDYKIHNIIDDIHNNKKIKTTKKTLNIRSVLRESDIVTISIGLNDFVEKMNKIDKDQLTLEYSKQIIDEISIEFDSMLKQIKKYAKNKIIVIGYYNPYNNYKYNYIVNYSNKRFNTICKNNDVIYIKISEVFNNKELIFPNPSSYYPNTLGYYKIFKKILDSV